MKNLSKIERSEQVEFSAQLAACLLLKGLAGARGRGQRLAAAAPNLVKDSHNIKIRFIDKLNGGI